MRIGFVTLLVGLLLSCPVLCGADEIGHDAAAGDASPGHDDCPEGDDGCVCQGAVQVDAVRATLPEATLAGLLYALVPHPCPLPPPLRLTPDGSATGLAGWGDATTVRAYLQNFRF